VVSGRDGLPFLVVGMTRFTRGVEGSREDLSYRSRRSGGYVDCRDELESLLGVFVEAAGLVVAGGRPARRSNAAGEMSARESWTLRGCLQRWQTNGTVLILMAVV
jgi:hypothetical protein